MIISSRTPEGRPNLCPVCGAAIEVEPSDPAGDAPCPHCGNLLWFTWDEFGDVITIKPKHNTLRSDHLDTLTDKALEKAGVQLVLDLCNVEYLSSTELGSLINLKKKVRGLKGRLRIENLRPELLEIFQITRLDQVFDIRR